MSSVIFKKRDLDKIARNECKPTLLTDIPRSQDDGGTRTRTFIITFEQFKAIEKKLRLKAHEFYLIQSLDQQKSRTKEEYISEFKSLGIIVEDINHLIKGNKNFSHYINDLNVINSKDRMNDYNGFKLTLIELIRRLLSDVNGEKLQSLSIS